ncbi:MAG TPA: hypothetical protein VK859_12980, partial [bacterium]|nr:hypothetical protein [bacterium]
MRKFLSLLLLFTLFPLLTTPLQAKPQPFFTVGWKDGKAWFRAPSGRPFLSMGVNAIADQSYRASNDDYYNPVKNQYDGNIKAWMKGVFIRLKRWHFNTIGCWSNEALLGQNFPFTDMLYLGRGNKWDDVLLSVFSDDFAALVKENAKKAAKYKDDPFLIGYFLDNEMPWWGDYGWHAEGQKTLLEKYALNGVDDANKQALRKFFETRYDQDIVNFDKAWNLKMTSFEELEAPVTLSIKTKSQKADADAWAG